MPKAASVAGEKISSDFLRLVSEFLHILNEVTPGTNLATDVKELGQHCQQEMRVAQEVAKMAVITAVFVFTLNVGEICPENQQSPAYRNRAQHQIGLDHSHRLGAKIRIVQLLGFHAVDLLRTNSTPEKMNTVPISTPVIEPSGLNA